MNGKLTRGYRRRIKIKRRNKSERKDKRRGNESRERGFCSSVWNSSMLRSLLFSCFMTCAVLQLFSDVASLLLLPSLPIQKISSLFLQSMFLPTLFPLCFVFLKSIFLFVTCHWRPPSQYIRWWCLKSCYRHKICVCPNSVMQSFLACPHPISFTCVSSVATF